MITKNKIKTIYRYILRLHQSTQSLEAEFFITTLKNIAHAKMVYSNN